MGTGPLSPLHTGGPNIMHIVFKVEVVILKVEPSTPDLVLTHLQLIVLMRQDTGEFLPASSYYTYDRGTAS
jgi:hypothetical protein